MDFLAATALFDAGDVAGLGELIAATPAMAHHTYRHETPMSDSYCLLLHLVSWPAGRPNAGATEHEDAPMLAVLAEVAAADW